MWWRFWNSLDKFSDYAKNVCWIWGYKPKKTKYVKKNGEFALMEFILMGWRQRGKGRDITEKRGRGNKRMSQAERNMERKPEQQWVNRMANKLVWAEAWVLVISRDFSHVFYSISFALQQYTSTSSKLSVVVLYTKKASCVWFLHIHMCVK